MIWFKTIVYNCIKTTTVQKDVYFMVETNQKSIGVPLYPAPISVLESSAHTGELKTQQTTSIKNTTQNRYIIGVSRTLQVVVPYREVWRGYGITPRGEGEVRTLPRKMFETMQTLKWFVGVFLGPERPIWLIFGKSISN